MSICVSDSAHRKNKWSEHCPGLNNFRNRLEKKNISMSGAATIGDEQGGGEVHAEWCTDGSWDAAEKR